MRRTGPDLFAQASAQEAVTRTGFTAAHVSHERLAGRPPVGPRARVALCRPLRPPTPR